MKREEKQDCIVEIVSRNIIHLKIRKYNDTVNKTGIWVNFFLPLFISIVLVFGLSKFQIKHSKALAAAGNEIGITFRVQKDNIFRVCSRLSYFLCRYKLDVPVQSQRKTQF